MEKRYFTEKEAARFVQLAAKLQEHAAEKGAEYSPGVSLDELRRVAAEAGIDPKFLDEAIASQSRTTEKRVPWSVVEKVVDGALDPNDYDVVREALGHGMRRSALRQVGRSLEGRTLEGGVAHDVRVTSRGGRTRVSVKPSLFPTFIFTIYPAVMLAFIGSAIASDAGFGAAWALGAVVGILGVVMFAWLAARAQGTAEGIADRVCRAAVDAVQGEQAEVRRALSGSGETLLGETQAAESTEVRS